MSLLTESKPPAQAATAEPVIRLESVSVRFRVPHERIPHIKEYAIRRLKRTVTYNDFWALKDIHLTVNRSAVVGIVGPNGAGKSTLLKVAAQVLRPTAGRVRTRGRVAPLLEVGTGFDFELTGRENVFLNGAILGFTQRDIAARFDRIVDFAGLWDFVDAPLRTYSTGMVTRLGFAIATDVPPDILIIDEILGVGDTEFQLKSADRIKAYRDRGATILVVSHNMAMIQAMCERVVWLEHGQVRASGGAAEVVQEYQAPSSAKGHRTTESGLQNRPAEHIVR